MSILTSYLLTIGSLLLTSSSFLEPAGDRTSQSADWLIFDTLALNINGPCYDVAFFADGIIFQKEGKGTAYFRELDQPDLEKSQPLFHNKQIACSPAALSFTGDYSRLYFTGSIEKGEQRSQEKIFEMSVADREVSGLSQLMLTGDDSRYLHPAVSFDGSLMIFSSDRLPTSGGLDLFVSRMTPDGWSEPLNLGKAINSSGHEWFPFLDSMKNLWFSSTGHSTYGGYDIFVCPYNGKDWDGPRNLGAAVNSPQNELGFSVHPRGKCALFSRVSPSGSGGKAIMLKLGEDASEKNLAVVLLSRADLTEPEAAPQINPEPVAVAIPAAKPDPDQVTFRVQIISSLNENSFPVVLIAGENHSTYEYFYKGSYRITVGQFESLEAANAFRLQCKNSGFGQAFVAAFRGDKRVTDPSVFKQ